MTRTLALALTATVLAGSAHAQSRAAAVPGAKQVDEAMAKALKANDLEAIMATYAEDAVFFPPGEMAQKGRAAIRAGFAGLLAAYRIVDFTVSDTHYAGGGDVSVAWGFYTLSVVPKGRGEPMRWEGRYSLVAKRRAGKWLAVSDHASMPLGPMGPPPGVPGPVSGPRR